MLLRFDPFRELDRTTQEWLRGSGSHQLPLDAYRRGDEFYIHLDVPGFDPDSIELIVEQDTLTVKAERTWHRHEGDEILVAERPEGAFSRQLMLGESLDRDRIAARCDRGVLTITIPVIERAKPRKVEVKLGRASGEVIEPDAR